ncbi:Na+/H+ antiporter NhaA [Lentzea sp. DG1S-22]|uniref:Na+/H+ antiporter NhaA n=1 Tax=Lentzea sp. DG1S-22 TaxID=3108822 RepID=UPI002E78AEC1|nr:Na+/H+ antiporter NhaA [Lentzea sp. DG1S-22]WVH82979.1 Na+/H+ antiporter NhaA [Lentzea sp. DG1S-22]
MTDTRLTRRVTASLRKFVHNEAAAGVVLLLATAAALVWANSAAAAGYQEVWRFRLSIGAGQVSVTEDLRHWVNDGLMVIFFFVVGLEIKRELVVGELRDRRAALLPALGALGGVVLPAVLFLVVVGGGPEARGWGVPLATDIAFAVGVLALLGPRVPAGVKLFLLSVAIVDDIIAVGVIALAYTEDLDRVWLLSAAVGLIVIAALRRLGIGSITFYVLVGLFVWYAALHSGVHATIAGVVLGLMTPARPVDGRDVLGELQHKLHPVSAFLVVPLFALANAGIDLRGGVLGEAAGSSVAWAVVIGLLAGKIAGIGGATWLALRTGIGTLPRGMPPRLIWGVAALAGIGFTVSLFITDLAYSDAGLVIQAKVGVFTASVVAAVLGSGLLLALSRRSVD